MDLQRATRDTFDFLSNCYQQHTDEKGGENAGGRDRMCGAVIRTSASWKKMWQEIETYRQALRPSHVILVQRLHPQASGQSDQQEWV
jgi:hypothetical protein